MNTGSDLREYYANVIDSVGDGVLVVDSEGLVTLANPAGEEITGISRRHAIGQPFSSLFAATPLLVEMVEKTAASGMTVSDHENIMLRTGVGHLTPVSATVSPLLMSDGKQTGSIVVLRDLSKIRELERAVRQADRLSALGTLAAGLAHEIKNPLGGIKGAAQLLERELTEDSDLRDYTRVMLREVQRVNRIVEELLDLTTPRKLQMEKVNLHKVLGDIITLQKRATDEKEITIQQHFDPSIPPLLGDEALLTQLFLNLVKNAVEAVGETGTVRVATRVLSDYTMTQKGEGRSRIVAIEIADDGPGIGREQQERLFTPFFTTKEKGTGLGLAISQKIVSEHRGMLKLDSVEGKGTTFTVMLPLVQ